MLLFLIQFATPILSCLTKTVLHIRILCYQKKAYLRYEMITSEIVFLLKFEQNFKVLTLWWV